MIALTKLPLRPCMRLLAIAALLLPGTLRQAHAQFEFGYKDRVFDQKYLLPDELPQSQITTVSGLLSAAFMVNQALAEAPSKPAVKKILGGQCAELLALDDASKGPMTDVQRAIEGLPDVERSLSDADDRIVTVPCRLQVGLFYAAFVDASSQEHQLRSLADHIRRRFADNWLAPAEMADPAIQAGAKRLAALQARTNRLVRKGMTLPDDIRDLVRKGTFKTRILSLAEDASYAALDAKLTALEQSAGAELARLQSERRIQQEAEEKRALRKRLIAEAEEIVAQTKSQLAQERESLRQTIMLAQMDPDPDSMAARSVGREKVFVQDSERLLQSAIAKRDKLLAHLAALDRADSGNAEAQIPTAQAQFNTTSVEQRNPQVQEMEPASHPQSGPLCGNNSRCQVSERTIFCRSFEQVQAVLSQPIGPQRRKVLTSLKNQGACLVLEVGTAVLVWGPSVAATPIGEAPVGVVPVAVLDGQPGYVLASALVADQMANR